ncbi:hypothetical protein [Paenarthrobacter sp. YJN-5]|uniref:hypothetical protein n=1 Tax=Paenarthrobacter sp. YJN-5 TaxID=2735316 RepID=UPI001877CDEE|nr:hypothetical protein [Paenarthrobacter sp. YJN-5]QOT19648.1 hypothetical protein HMI59_23845 [Paenarthrobacter sp. YJN-5]
MSRRKNITLAASATALALALGIGATTMASATTTPTPSPSNVAGDATDGHQDRGGHGKGGDRIAADLAAKLGVDQAKVADALKSFRDARKADRSSKEAALAKSLADSLGIDEAKVTAAINELRSNQQKPDRGEVLKSRLDKAVAAGTLTQAEADAVTKAVEKGVLGGGKH